LLLHIAKEMILNDLEWPFYVKLQLSTGMCSSSTCVLWFSEAGTSI